MECSVRVLNVAQLATYVTVDGGSLLKPRLVPTSQGGDQPVPSCCQGDTCLELLGSEIGRNDTQREDIQSDMLEELHKKMQKRWKIPQHWKTLRGVQWVGLGSKSQDEKSCLLVGHGSGHLVTDPTEQGRMRLQQFQPGGAIDGATSCTTPPPVQDSHAWRNRAVQLRLTSLPGGDTRKWVNHGATEDKEVESKSHRGICPKNCPKMAHEAPAKKPPKLWPFLETIQNGSKRFLQHLDHLPKPAGFGNCEDEVNLWRKERPFADLSETSLL